MRKRKLDESNTIWSAEASRILGISKSTFNTRLHKGLYKVSCVRCPMGYRYSITDIVKIAHPRLKDREIEEFIMDYRAKVMAMRKRKKTGVKK